MKWHYQETLLFFFFVASFCNFSVLSNRWRFISPVIHDFLLIIHKIRRVYKSNLLKHRERTGFSHVILRATITVNRSFASLPPLYLLPFSAKHLSGSARKKRPVSLQLNTNCLIISNNYKIEKTFKRWTIWTNFQ